MKIDQEKIDELAYTAGCHQHKYWDPKHPDLEGFIISREKLDRFAELIVQTCINEIHVANVGDLKGKGYYLDKVAEHIETYFGEKNEQPY